MQQALNLYADRNTPDYRNSIKESISAVESLARQLTKKDKFSAAINELKTQGVIEHNAMKEALGNLYGYSSDEDGIRHPIMEQDTITSSEAKYMLVICSAFVNYLIEKMEIN